MTHTVTRAARARPRRRVWTIAAAVVVMLVGPNLVSAAQQPNAPALVPPLPPAPILPVPVVLPVPPLPEIAPPFADALNFIQHLPDNTVVDVPRGTAANPAASLQQPPRASDKQPHGLYGAAYIGGSELEPSGRAGRHLGFGLDLKGVGPGRTQVTGSYIHGWNPGLFRGYQYGLHRSRLAIGVKAPSWTFIGGQLALHDRSFQPPVTADGMLLERTQGRVIGSILA
ncbi:MAG: hypothetical protein LC804_11250, partial [Acidobacteria bacterium]|nr:hypothetical protein [Acidobacteriota bacterium]